MLTSQLVSYNIAVNRLKINLFIKDFNIYQEAKPMADSFELLTGGVTRIYKSIQKIKRLHMDSIGLKGTHVMCIHYLYTHPEGLTGTELCAKCKEDKAGISRILSDLERSHMISYQDTPGGKRYRTKAVLTDEGRSYGAKVNALINHAVIAGRGSLSAKDSDTFYRVLFTIADNLEALCSEIEKRG